MGLLFTKYTFVINLLVLVVKNDIVSNFREFLLQKNNIFIRKLINYVQDLMEIFILNHKNLEIKCKSLKKQLDFLIKSIH